MRSLASQLHFRFAVSGAVAVGNAVMLLIGGYRAWLGHITIGDLYLFLSYLGALYSPLQTLAYLSVGLATAKGKARRVFELLDANSLFLSEPTDVKALPAVESGAARAICFKGVSFIYRGDERVLDQIDLTIQPGQHIAIVGPTGAGKTTLASLIPRFADPTRGSVLLDGCDVRHLALADIRHQVAWVPQQPMLLPMTIAENIAFARPNASRQQIVYAARAAGLHAFVERLPDGYNTLVGERGSTLSGGQAQRLAIARALLKNASIVILDEPTASLDAQTEMAVMDAIDRLTKGRTTIIIAHRLSTIRWADRIIVLEQGHIAESGTHQQLIKRGGVYAQLCQADVAAWRRYSTISKQKKYSP